jgi:hypothetical protein
MYGILWRCHWVCVRSQMRSSSRGRERACLSIINVCICMLSLTWARAAPTKFCTGSLKKYSRRHPSRPLLGVQWCKIHRIVCSTPSALLKYTLPLDLKCATWKIVKCLTFKQIFAKEIVKATRNLTIFTIYMSECLDTHKQGLFFLFRYVCLSF